MKIKLYMCGGEKPKSEFSLGVGYLKANSSADVQIVKHPSELKECDMIGLSSAAQGIKEVLMILKSAKIPIIIGGQITLWKPLQNYPFKHIVVGEGERPFQMIIDGSSKRIFKHIVVDDIDTLKFPERGNCNKIVPIITSRGCPWNCHFCSSTKFWKTTRYHSPKYFMSEVEYILKRYSKAATLYILDDLFVSNAERFYEIANLWLGQSMYKRLKISSFIRSNTFTLEMAKTMKKMNFCNVRFGAESGSNRILKLLNKQSTVEMHQRTIDICNQVGLHVGASFMREIPGETAEDIKATRDFIDRNKGKFQVQGNYHFKPFPGTPFYGGEDIRRISMRVR